NARWRPWALSTRIARKPSTRNTAHVALKTALSAGSTLATAFILQLHLFRVQGVFRVPGVSCLQVLHAPRARIALLIRFRRSQSNIELAVSVADKPPPPTPDTTRRRAPPPQTTSPTRHPSPPWPRAPGPRRRHAAT